MLTRRAGRRSEGGQVLIMALAFIAFFGLLTTAVLQFADTVEVQQSHSQSSSAANAAAEGGMMLALEAAGEQGGCVVGSTGSIDMAGPGTARYATTACNPGATANLIADQCGLCVENPSGVPDPLTVQGSVRVQGPIGVSGGVSNTAQIVSTIATKVPSRVASFIGCTAACGSASANYQPQKLTRGPVPMVAAPPVRPAHHCSAFTGTDGGAIPSGCYSDISVDCSAVPAGQPCSYTLDGTYVLGGQFSIGAQATVTSTGGVLLALLPPDGSLLVDAGGSLSLGPSVTAGNPDDVTVYVDPSDTAANFTLDGGTLDVTGTVDAGTASVNIFGTGDLTTSPNNADPASGRLIVGGLTLTAAASVMVGAAPPNPGYCWVYSDRILDNSGTSIGTAAIESDCSGGSSTGIISVDYGP